MKISYDTLDTYRDPLFRIEEEGVDLLSTYEGLGVYLAYGKDTLPSARLAGGDDRWTVLLGTFNERYTVTLDGITVGNSPRTFLSLRNPVGGEVVAFFDIPYSDTEVEVEGSYLGVIPSDWKERLEKATSGERGVGIYLATEEERLSDSGKE